MEYITAFVIGGLICAAVQILLDRTKMMPGRVMVLLVCTGAGKSYGAPCMYRSAARILRDL